MEKVERGLKGSKDTRRVNDSKGGRNNLHQVLKCLNTSWVGLIIKASIGIGLRSYKIFILIELKNFIQNFFKNDISSYL